ncbi:TolC family protein [Leptospira brenneri]|uniref:TolC family protein n=1 Tax=Leptospira brenneri TaxID=2023182 RepID=A0A2M9Y412_9LEPT|nr:TolC family protein [Leptospira brenneri]PJZ46334.1 channel protein TolC [Leptospira brenneri]TGK96431.1 TolC family protein [Leptospira brenneri]
MNLVNSHLFRFGLFFIGSFFVFFCSSRQDIKVGDGVVEDSLKKITGVTTKDLERTLSKNSMGLNDLFVLAVEKTERIALKDEATNLAKYGKNKAMAGFLPTLSYVYNKFYSIPGHTADPTPLDNYKTYQAIQTENYASLLPSRTTSSTLPPTVGAGSRLLLSFPLSNGLLAYQDYKAYTSLAEQRRMEAKFEAGRMYMEIALAYYNVLQLEDSLNQAEESLNLHLEAAKEKRRLFSLGKILRYELLNSETAVTNAQAVLEDTKSQLEQVQLTLSTMVGMDSKITLESSVPRIESPNIENVDDILVKRYDVISSKKGIEVAKANETKAMFGFAPNVAVNTFYSFPTPGQTHSKDVTAQLAITMPLTPLTQYADLEMAESATKQAKLTASQTRRAAVQEIQNAIQNLKNSEKLFGIYEKAYQFALDTLKSQESAYYLGRTSLADLIGTKISTLNSKMALQKMNYQRHLNRVVLGVATGELPLLTGTQSSEE